MQNMVVFFPFKDSFAKDDIALVRLRDPVSFGPYVNNIELNTDDNYPPDGKVCFTQGWGCTSNNGNLCNLSFIYISINSSRQVCSVFIVTLYVH